MVEIVRSAPLDNLGINGVYVCRALLNLHWILARLGKKVDLVSEAFDFCLEVESIFST